MEATPDEPVPPVAADERHLPLAQRRFPFRPLNEVEVAEVREAAGLAIMAMWPAIRKHCRRYLPSSRGGHDLEDAAQNVALHIFTHSLPRFDAHRGVKLSTFLYRCIWQAAFAEGDKAKSRPTLSTMPGQSIDRFATNQESQENRVVERVIEDIAADANQLLNHRHADLILQARDELTCTEIGEQIGLKLASTVSTVKWQLRQRAKRLLDDAI